MIVKKPRILMVDDDPVNLKLLEKILDPREFDVARAVDGQQAMDKTSLENFDLILLDVMMPRLDGFEVTRRLRKDPRTRLTPIVLLTALRETRDRVTGIEAGCDDFISKPFDVNEVLARVRALLKISYYRSLLNEKEKFEYVVDHISEGIVVLARDLSISSINARATAYFGLAKPENAKLDFLDLLQGTFQTDHPGALKELLLSKPGSFHLIRPGSGSQEPLILAVRSNPVRNLEQEIDHIALVITDVTEEHDAAFRKQAFIRLIAQKIESPLAVLDGYLAVLEKGQWGPLSDKVKLGLAACRVKSSELQAITTKLARFTGSLGWQRSPSDGILDLTAYFRLKKDTWPLEFQKADFQFSVQPRTRVRVFRDYFDLVLTHLVENAVKFNPREIGRISVSVRKKNGKVEVAVRDDGRGMPKEFQKKVLEPFFQIDGGNGPVTGLGLGLAIAARMARQYGGELKLSSQKDKGTAVRLVLPAA